MLSPVDRESEAQALFDEVDVDGAGYVDFDDIQRAHVRLELGAASDDDLRRFFAELDRDGTAPRVSRAAFVAAMALLSHEQMAGCSASLRRGANMRRLARNVEVGGEIRTRTHSDVRARVASGPPRARAGSTSAAAWTRSPPIARSGSAEGVDSLNVISDAMSRMLEEAKFAMTAVAESPTSSSSGSGPLTRTPGSDKGGSAGARRRVTDDGDVSADGLLVGVPARGESAGAAGDGRDGDDDDGDEGDDKLLRQLTSGRELDDQLIEAITGRISLVEREKRLLRSQLDEVTRKSQKLEQKLAQMDEDIFGLQQENIRLKKRCFEAQESLFEANNNFDSVQHQLNVRQEEVAKLKRQLREQDSERQGEVEQLRARVAQLETAVLHHKDREETQRSRIHKLDYALLSLQDELKAERGELARQLAVLQESDHQQLHAATVLQLTRELEQAQQEAQAARRELEALHRSPALGKKAGGTGGGSGGGAGSQTAEQLHTVINGMTQQLTDLRAENNDLRKHNEHYLAVLSEQQLQSDALLTSPSQLMTEREALATDIGQASTAELQRRVLALADENRSVRNYMDRLLAQIMLREDLMFLLRRE